MNKGVTFKIMTEMVQKKSIGFAVQISRLLQNAGFGFTLAADGTSATVIDSENFVALRPKPLTVLEFLDVKKKIGKE